MDDTISSAAEALSHIISGMSTWQQNVKNALVHRGKQRQELADAIGVSPSRLSHWLSGRHEPNMDMLRRIAAALDMSFPELTEGDDRFISDATELEVIRLIRTIDDKDRATAIALIRAVLRTIKQPTD